jgi:hypothetical protein
MKYFIFIIICSLGIANTALAQDTKKLYFETGAHLGYNTNIGNIYKEHLQLRAYNGTSLGAYIAMKRKKFVLQLNADYVFSQYKIDYTHPQHNEIQLKINEHFGTIKYGISTGINIPLAAQNQLELLIGFYHAIDMVDKVKILHKDDVVAEYDAGINIVNNKIYLANRTYLSSKDYLLSHLTLKY